MKYLKTFEQIKTELKSGKLDKVTSDFCEGIITESEFLLYLDGQINEGLLDWLKGVKEKIVDMFYTFVIKAYQIGLAIYDKVSTFINWLINKIKDWREKHPVAWKVTVITLVIIIILIVSASTAKAATTGQPIPVERIDMAIGWLDKVKSGGGEDPMIVGKAIAHLVDLRDGQIDLPNLGSEAINMANAALGTVDKIIIDSKTQTDPQFFQFCVGLMEKGKDYVEAIYTQGGGLENLKLVIK